MVTRSRFRQVWLTLSCLMVGLLTSAACQPTPAPAGVPTSAPQAGATATTSTIGSTSAATPTTAAAIAPAATFKRGEGGTLKILYHQAPTLLNSHLSSGTKDVDAARLVLEPLGAFGPDAQPVAILGAEVPTLQNGGISADYKTVTWKLKQGVKWSDGSDFTADDVVFTYQYCSNLETGCVSTSAFDGAEKVEAVDQYTIKITWKDPNGNPFQMYMGNSGVILQKKQFQDVVGVKAKDAPANLKPIGTGPYMIRDFKPNDVIFYDANPNYRDPNKPYFKEVQWKGGGDAASAARAVLETGEFDYAWNLQVEPVVIQQYAQGGKGELFSAIGSSVERIAINFTDPNKEVDGERSSVKTKHPFLSDLRVRQALAMAIDRRVIAEQLFGPSGQPACNLVVAPKEMVSPNITKCDQDLAGANKLLDDAGWRRGGDGIREKDGVKMKIVFQTSVSSVRQGTQEIAKAAWKEIGIDTEIKTVPSGVYFSTDPASPDTFGKFYADVEMYANSPGAPDPTATLQGWTTARINTKENGWRPGNLSRYSNPEYDNLHAQLLKEVDPKKRNDLIIRMNDILIKDVVLIPLIARTGPNSAKSKTLKGIVPTAWDSEMWNVADWYK